MVVEDTIHHSCETLATGCSGVHKTHPQQIRTCCHNMLPEFCESPLQGAHVNAGLQVAPSKITHIFNSPFFENNSQFWAK